MINTILEQNNTLPSDLVSLAYGNGKFVAVNKPNNVINSKKDSFGYIGYSDNGVNWWKEMFFREYEHTTVDYSFDQVIYKNKMFLAVGCKNRITKDCGLISKIQKSGIAMMSCTGDSWTEIKLPYTSDFYSVASGEEKTVILCEDGKVISLVLEWGIRDFNKSIGLRRSGEKWRNITYNESLGKFVATSVMGKKAYSMDGIKWKIL